jgi:short-subunit dehydrogenase
MNVIVTGATKGIGRAIVEKFAEIGANLAICARTTTDLEHFRTELREKYPTISVLIKAVDVSKPIEVIQFADFVKIHWQTVDVLVNNAGIFLSGGLAEEADGHLEQMMNTNLYSAYHLSRAIFPMMKVQKSGHIFNMCSIASIIAYPYGGSYTITKFALLGLSKVMRAEWKTEGIRVTSILPGATWSDSWQGFEAPEDRLMKAEDVAATVLAAYQLSPQAVVEEIIIRPQLGDL